MLDKADFDGYVESLMTRRDFLGAAAAIGAVVFIYELVWYPEDVPGGRLNGFQVRELLRERRRARSSRRCRKDAA